MEGLDVFPVIMVQVAGASTLSLVVETEFSANARCVWLDPHLLLSPLPVGFVAPTASPSLSSLGTDEIMSGMVSHTTMLLNKSGHQ